MKEVCNHMFCPQKFLLKLQLKKYLAKKYPKTVNWFSFENPSIPYYILLKIKRPLYVFLYPRGRIIRDYS